MDHDIDAAIAILSPWRLRLKLGGEWFETREPTVAEIAAFMEIGKTESTDRNKEAVELVIGLFKKPKEAAAKMKFSAMAMVVGTIIGHCEAFAAKNSPAVARATAPVAAATSAGGDSSAASFLPSQGLETKST